MHSNGSTLPKTTIWLEVPRIVNKEGFLKILQLLRHSIFAALFKNSGSLPFKVVLDASRSILLIQLKREARLKGGFYVNPKAMMLFIIRITGINAMTPS
ncbi:putative ribosomal protein L7/L30 [Helianthus anomalus]